MIEPTRAGTKRGRPSGLAKPECCVLELDEEIAEENEFSPEVFREAGCAGDSSSRSSSLAEFSKGEVAGVFGRESGRCNLLEKRAGSVRGEGGAHGMVVGNYSAGELVLVTAHCPCPGMAKSHGYKLHQGQLPPLAESGKQ